MDPTGTAGTGGITAATPVQLVGQVRFRVLGPLEIVEGHVSHRVGGPRRRSLLAVLLLSAGRPMSRERLIDEVWGDKPPRTAVKALQVHIGGLRRLLGERLRTEGSGYLVDVLPGEVDADSFDAIVAAARQHSADDPARTSAVLAAALSLWRGDAFADVPQRPIVAGATARLRELRLEALEERIEADLAVARHARLVSELAGLVSEAPARERFSAQLMLALHRSGRSGEALAAFVNLRETLHRELGVDPCDEVVVLEQAIRRNDATLLVPAPPPLPVPVSGFVGRQREVAEGRELLARSRLVTLVGTGGAGKSRLGLEVARRAVPDHPDGTFLVDLSGLSPSQPVERRVAAALGVVERTGEPFVAGLREYLRHRRVLLLLDNCERVGAACAGLCRDLLEVCPGLRVLATSREPLGLPCEFVWRLPGLDFPDEDATDAEAAATDAVRLLVARARAAGASVVVEGGGVKLAAAVCRGVDGLPLAIELVAARLASLSLEQVAARFDGRPALLAAPSPDPADRPTMRAAITWIHDQLDEAERRLFRRLAVFAGSFGLEAATEVGADPRYAPTSHGAVLACLERLVDKSMLQAQTGSHDDVRYQLLDTLRVYAQECLLESGEVTAARERHAGWFQRLAESAGTYGGSDHQGTVLRFDRDRDNLHAALGWYLGDGGQPERALAMAAPLWWYWWVRGLTVEGRTWLQRCLAAVSPEPSPVRGFGLRAAAALARHGGDLAEARRFGEDCLQVYRALGDPPGLAAALNSLGVTATAQGDLEAAIRLGEESVRRARQAGEPRYVAMSLSNLGASLRALGRAVEAETALSEALDGFLAVGDRRGEAAALSNLAGVARYRGQHVRARSLAMASLQIYHALGLVGGQLDVVEAVATMELDAGQAHVALRLLTVAGLERERRLLGVPVLPPDRLAEREDALAAAREAMGAASSRTLAAARVTSLDTVVAELLSVAPAQLGP